ncbi:MAG: metallophosphoesterase [Lachnospiraceae bacterium]|nr:metallophosphoesterase [Lachnospiraceae bacterium]MDY5742029.1 metallophosphoesterase [Lachnospiraceae bacterium]
MNNTKHLRLFCVSDLHLGTERGQTERLLRQVRAAAPDLILIVGDLMTAKLPESQKPAGILLISLAKVAPVILSLGNHEQKWPEVTASWRRLSGVTVLDNEKLDFRWGEQHLMITGLTLPEDHFKRIRRPSLTMKELYQCIGRRQPADFHILMAHHPAYSRQYRQWGANLIVSGHYHGGLVRLPLLGGLLSPQLVPFPHFSKGTYRSNGRLHVVMAGAGEHTGIPRLGNPKEVLLVDLIKSAGRIGIGKIERWESR